MYRAPACTLAMPTPKSDRCFCNTWPEIATTQLPLSACESRPSAISCISLWYWIDIPFRDASHVRHRMCWKLTHV